VAWRRGLRVTQAAPDDIEPPRYTTVPDHGSRDIPRGTLGAIEKDMEPCLGPKWLLK
jgi:hypothetical protein